MKRRKVIARDENGKEYIFESIATAVTHLNIAATTIKRHEKNKTSISTKFGNLTFKFEDEP